MKYSTEELIQFIAVTVAVTVVSLAIIAAIYFGATLSSEQVHQQSMKCISQGFTWINQSHDCITKGAVK